MNPHITYINVSADINAERERENKKKKQGKRKKKNDTVGTITIGEFVWTRACLDVSLCVALCDCCCRYHSASRFSDASRSRGSIRREKEVDERGNGCMCTYLCTYVRM